MKDKCQHEWTQLIGRNGSGVREATSVWSVVSGTGYRVKWIFYCRKCLEEKVN